MAPSPGTIAYLYHHVVLPPKLPQKSDNSDAHEPSLLEMAIQALNHLMISVNAAHKDTVVLGRDMVENLRGNRDVHGNVSEVQLESLLSDLLSGHINGPVPLEVKAQNAGVLINRCEERVNFEFFELSPTNEAAVRSSRLTRTFPSHGSCIALDKMMDSSLRKSIACTIAKMSTQSAPGSQPQIRKNGKEEDEDRDTAAPGLVTDCLFNITTALGNATVASPITKATREDVLWSDCRQPWRRSPLWLLIRVSLQL